MKFTKKKIIVISAAAALAIGLALTAAFAVRSKGTRTIGFYGLAENQTATIRSILEESNRNLEKSVKLNFKNLNAGKKVECQAKSVDLLFLSAGLNADRITAMTEKKNGGKNFFDPSIIRSSSMSAASFAMTRKGADKNTITQVPLLFDGYEILLSIQSITETQMKMLETWVDLEAFAENSKKFTPYPIIFAGGDDDCLLGVLSILVESFEGREAYEAMVEKIASYDGTMKDLVEELASGNQALEESLSRILRWNRKEIFSTDMLRLGNDEARNLIENFRSAVIIMSLSQHRLIAMNSVQKFTTLPIHTNESSFYVPSIRPLNQRSLVTPATVMISMTADERTKKLAESMTTISAQEILCHETGLSPLLANCRIPDIQSDDIRFWIAATSQPVVPIYDGAFSDSSRKAEFAAAVRQWISSHCKK